MQLAVPPGNSTFREAMVMGSFLKIGHLSRGFDWPKLEVEHKNWDWNGWDVNGSEKQHWETTQSTGQACLIIIFPIKVVLHGDIPPVHTPIMESDSHDSAEQRVSSKNLPCETGQTCWNCLPGFNFRK